MITLALVALAFASTSAPPPPTPTTLPTQPTTTTTTTTTIVPTGPTTTIPIPAGYMPLEDDSHTIVLAVPDTWTDVNTGPYYPTDEGTEPPDGQPSIVASPDIQQFIVSFDVPGVSYFAVPFRADPISYLNDYGLTGGCVDIAFKEYDDPVFVGYVQIGTDCGPLHMTWNMVVANPIGSSAFTAIVQVQTSDPAELETVLRTFNTA